MNAPDIERLTNPTRLIPWLDEFVPELGRGPLKSRVLGTGTSNVVLLLSRGERSMVLRRPPQDLPPNSARSNRREVKVLRALRGTSVPHPNLIGSCDDDSVLGCHFYLMEFIDGWSGDMQELHTNYPEAFRSGPNHRALGAALVGGLIQTANLDYVSVGLGSFGKPRGFLERQVDRWLSQLAGYPKLYAEYVVRDLPGLEFIAAWLRRHRPEHERLGLMHGDYAASNCLFAHDTPTKLLAIIDWELATIGDPLLDLASVLLQVPDARGPEFGSHEKHFDPVDFPSRQDLLAVYGRETGRSTESFDYYLVLAYFRYACILEYKVAEAASGIASKEKGDRFARTVLRFLAAAESIARHA